MRRAGGWAIIDGRVRQPRYMVRRSMRRVQGQGHVEKAERFSVASKLGQHAADRGKDGDIAGIEPVRRLQ